MANDFRTGIFGNFLPANPDDPTGQQQFQGGQNWNIFKPGAGFAGIPYNQTYGGQHAPYNDSGAQILDSLLYSNRVAQDNPMAVNKAGRYSFGGGGGYGGQYGLLGGGRRANAQGAIGGMAPHGDNFPGLTPVNVPQGQAQPAGQGTNWPQMNNLLSPSQPMAGTQQQQAEIFNAGGPNPTFGTALDRGQAITATGSMGSQYNPSRIAAISQMLAGSTPQQVMNNPMMGAAGGNYYNLDGSSTGLNPGAAPMGATAPGTDQAYLTQIAGLLGTGR